MTDAYFRALLTKPPDSSAGILHPGQAVLEMQHHVVRQMRHHPGSLGHHDRSSSAPNVCLNNVKSLHEDYPRLELLPPRPATLILTTN